MSSQGINSDYSVSVLRIYSTLTSLSPYVYTYCCRTFIVESTSRAIANISCGVLRTLDIPS